MPDRVTVRVPATSANLGSGFDSLGLALDLTADVTIALEPAEHTQPIDTLVIGGARAAYRAAGRSERHDFSVDWQGDLPIARGLGASAAARAAGLVAANALMDGPLSLDELFALGAGLEGHGDNMAPALFGGFQIIVHDGDAWRRLAVPIAAGLKVVLYVPDFAMPTQESRKKLPQKLSREEAVFNIGRAAMLVAALAQGRWDLLDSATQDRIHQPARGKLFPALFDVFDAAKEAGAHAAYLSGGGSTVAAFTTEHEERIARVMQQAAIARGFSGKTLITQPSEHGARIVSR
jgi:homoserine kinase